MIKTSISLSKNEPELHEKINDLRHIREHPLLNTTQNLITNKTKEKKTILASHVEISKLALSVIIYSIVIGLL